MKSSSLLTSALIHLFLLALLLSGREPGGGQGANAPQLVFLFKKHNNAPQGSSVGTKGARRLKAGSLKRGGSSPKEALRAPHVPVEPSVGAQPGEFPAGALSMGESESALEQAQFTYVSYFERIRQKMEWRWRDLVYKLFSQWRIEGRPGTSMLGMMDTTVIVTLGSNGDVLRVRVTSGSGFYEVDGLALKALRDSINFPNPPKLLAKNGPFDVGWEFRVHVH